jgi:hypothetical protein
LATVACLLWVAAPSQLATPMLTPSTFGLRFTPALVLVWCLVVVPDRKLWAAAAWCFCMAWSIESAFYALAIYWPARMWQERARLLDFRNLCRVSGRLVLELAVLLAAYTCVFLLLFRAPPDIGLLILYALNPPGPLPVNWAGPIWWLISVFAFALFTLLSARAGDDPDSDPPTLYIALLAAVAFTSYYLGRSHDNNVLNLMPAVAMLLCAMLGETRDRWSEPISRALLVTPLMLLAYLSFDAWTLPRWTNGSDYKVMSHDLARYPEVARAVAEIDARYREPITVMDQGDFLLAARGAAGVWHGLHPLMNFAFVTEPERRRAVRAGADRLARPGWVIVHRTLLGDPMLVDLQTVYRPTEWFVSGSYVAIRFQPR